MKKFWVKLKAALGNIFIDGLAGMALGLFATLIIGTIIQQIGTLLIGIDNNFISAAGAILFVIGKIAASLTGAGIGCGVAYKLKASPLVLLSAATAGMIGAFAGTILSIHPFSAATIAELAAAEPATTISNAVLAKLRGVSYISPGEPFGAFIAAYTAIKVGELVSGKTKVDILVTPFVSIMSGAVIGLLIGPPISSFITWLGSVINWGVEQEPFFAGIIVSAIMGIVLTLPISSAAIGVALGLNGIAAGAAVAGCCAHMVGFAVASYRDNKMGGLLAQGVGTSMLQMPNIVRKPIIFLPAVVASIITGPISTCVFQMKTDKIGAGMGTSGLVGQITTFQVMAADGVYSKPVILLLILLVHFIIPAAIALLTSEIMRKKKLILPGDMKLDL